MELGYLLRVRGQVQGVGFRPHCWQLARRMGLRGWVLNDAQGVLIAVAGLRAGDFAAALRADAPPLARIEVIEVTPHRFDNCSAPGPGFEIRASGGPGAETRVTPDAATCPDCLADIRGTGRRAGYAFTNCTNCGPRFTIVTGLPYDRAQTTMAPFALCPACRAEYEDPADRRFHAQPVACPDCGPRTWLATRDGAEVPGEAIALAAERLRAGEILAIKGLGGYHLCCDATNAAAIERLRARKHRPTKPLALMAPLALIRRHATVSDAAATRLADPAAPILLLPRAGKPLPDSLAPGLDELGWMLPATPLHHLLSDAMARPLVMTSGNLSGEPQAIGNDEARATLGGIAEAFVQHDRAIARRLDDQVERMSPRGPVVLRRGRGSVPGTLPLPPGLPDGQVLACGGQMKSAICLVKSGRALLSHHLGELDAPLTWQAYQQADGDYAGLFDHAPEAVAVDRHPDFRASQHGAERARAAGLPLVRVQHHHAHMAACMAEAGWGAEDGPVAGIILDGLGLGDDGTVWGGEILLGSYAGARRAAALAPAPLPGGDRAQSEPWRNAVMRLDAAGLGAAADRLFPDAPRALLRQAASSGMNAPLSSSVGRLFDAAAACLGICPDAQGYEGEAAMRLEALAGRARDVETPRWDLAEGVETGTLDPAPLFHGLIEGLARGTSGAALARGVHLWIADSFARPARALVARGEARAVALSGGCFQNALLSEMITEALCDLPVLHHADVPAGDGGLALGQAVIALARRGADWKDPDRITW
ncbi:Carbamoyltransferase HypF [Pseudooceanicola marinus]|uniref:Carbamoyltransferase HypF n=1 Tax=Pseudooceanicola marinus TaxID=396013 RepID=A0A1X6ZA85_9RHOB|nr:carbamoyltransferase HypF [Pseudooceanicola marinus]PJE28181.1 carbamoyltransferase HypF [Pseudooceanicola marinus]SLN45396.1 Carbamoyltransferase HypF [Pseudooceanicola marinus]